MTAVRSRKQPISQPDHSGKWSRNPLYSHNLIEAGSERESSEGEKEKRERKERDRERERFYRSHATGTTDASTQQSAEITQAKPEPEPWNRPQYKYLSTGFRD